jgi:CBS domain-containing protein
MTSIEPSVSIKNVMSHATITCRPDVDIEALIATMTTNHIGCIPIVDSENRPVGIVTKLDLIECRHAGPKTARDVMMPCAMTLMETDTVGRAAKLMSAEGFHHVLVVNKERSLVGVVSTLDLTRWLASCS